MNALQSLQIDLHAAQVFAPQFADQFHIIKIVPADSEPLCDDDGGREIDIGTPGEEV